MPQLLGAKLRYLRHQRHMTQSELSGYLGLASHGHVTNVETGRRAGSIELVLRIVDFFEVTTDYLLRDDVPVEVVAATGHTVLPTPEPQLFGEKLRYLRTLSNLNQQDLSQRLSLASRAYVSNLESGRKMPSLELVVQIADVFGVTTDYLLRDTVPVTRD